ncbi:MAG: hypothetical protein IJB83_04660 [Bacilli bacterium]|nr:hypothetical protein [Bacilli bacterium]
MNNIKIAIKRFLRNKNTVTILVLILCVGLIYWGYNRQIKKNTEPVNVPYALREIEPRTLITSEMIGTIKVAKKMVSSGVLRSTNQIVGKYVNYDATVPAGSMFYESVLVDWKDMPNSLWQDIEAGSTVVSLPVDLDSTYGNSIFPGNYIDLYYVTVSNEDGKNSGKLIFGKFIESIKVLSVIDGDGNNVFEKTVDVSTPSNLVFAVDEEYHLLLRKASYLSGTIVPVPRNADYSASPGNTKVSSSYIRQYILRQTLTVDDTQLDNLTYDENIDNSDNNGEVSK